MFPSRISIFLDIIFRSIIHFEIFLCVCYEVRVEIFLTFLLPHHILPSPFPSSHPLLKIIIFLKNFFLLLLSFFWFQVYIYLSWCHLLKIIIISSLNCIGTFVRNQLTINIMKHFWTLNCVPLASPILLPILQYLNYYNFAVTFENR